MIPDNMGVGQAHVPPHLQHCQTNTIPGKSFVCRPPYPEEGYREDPKAPIGLAYRPLTYLASPYSHPHIDVREQRYRGATEAAAWLIKNNQWNVFAPITHSHPLATIGGLRVDWEFWRKLDEQFIRCSQRLVVLELDGWRESVGVQAEIKIAQEQGISVWYMAATPAPCGFILCERGPSWGSLAQEECKESLRRSDGPPQCPEGVATSSEPVGCIFTDTQRVDFRGAKDAVKECHDALVAELLRAPTSKADSTNPKDIVGSTKVSLSKLPAVALAHGAHAMMDGARKYDCYNWRAKKVQASIYVDAAMRHLWDWFEGEEDAPDSKVHHLGHCLACCAILLDCQEMGNMIDDRPVTDATRGIMTRVLARLQEKVKQMPPLEKK